MHNVERIDGAHYEAVTVAELKTHCFVYHNADDTYLASLAIAAREQVEKDLGLALVLQTYALHTECSFPASLRLPIKPLLEVLEIGYTDTEDQIATLDESSYTVKAYRDPPEITFNNPPSGTDVTVYFDAGYDGDEESNLIPQLYKQAVLFLAKHWYDSREAASEVSLKEVPLGYDRIISRCRTWSFK